MRKALEFHNMNGFVCMPKCAAFSCVLVVAVNRLNLCESKNFVCASKSKQCH